MFTNQVKQAMKAPLARSMASQASKKEVEAIGNFGSMAQPKLQLFGLHSRYANALYSVAAKNKSLESVEKELASIMQSIDSDARFANFLKDPTIPKNSKQEDIRKVVKEAKFSEPVRGLFEVLSENGRLAETRGVIDCYQKLMSAYRNEVQAKVTSADSLSKSQLDQVKKSLEKRLKKEEKLILETEVDPDILGGLKVQLGNYFIDLSLATKVDKINQVLVNTPVTKQALESAKKQ